MGRLVPRQWCFGGIERGSNKCFIVAVEHRDATTLVPLVQQYILPGTTIISDKWAAYNGIQDLPEGYQHLTVNHKLHFIDLLSGACTNTIESLWQKFKGGHRSGMGLYRLCWTAILHSSCGRSCLKRTRPTIYGPKFLNSILPQLFSRKRRVGKSSSVANALFSAVQFLESPSDEGR